MKIVFIAVIILCCIGIIYTKFKKIFDNTYVHKSTGNLYYKFHEGKMKNPDTGEWIECVFYVAEKDCAVYARETKSFNEKFIPWNEHIKKNGLEVDSE